jgi:hypothetical protein
MSGHSRDDRLGLQLSLQLDGLTRLGLVADLPELRSKLLSLGADRPASWIGLLVI